MESGQVIQVHRRQQQQQQNAQHQQKPMEIAIQINRLTLLFHGYNHSLNNHERISIVDSNSNVR